MVVKWPTRKNARLLGYEGRDKQNAAQWRFSIEISFEELLQLGKEKLIGGEGGGVDIVCGGR